MATERDEGYLAIQPPTPIRREGDANNEGFKHQTPTEITSLLPKHRAERHAPVHYRDCISGPRFYFLYWSVLFGCTIAFFDTTLMASSHPVITSFFNASNAASWLTTVFYLTSTVFQPILGRVSDTIGRRPVLLFAIVTFFLSTAWCGGAGSVGSFIAARAVSGIGAGGVMSLTSVLTSDMVKIEYRGIYQSYYNLVYGIGHGLGAALGGYLCDKIGWRSAFYIQLPFIGVYGLLAVLSCPDNLGPNLARTQRQTVRSTFSTFDFYGTLAMLFAVSGLILGVNMGGNIFSWTHPLVIASLVIAFLAGGGLILVERKAERPILPLQLFSTTPVANVILGNFAAAMGINAVLFNVPLYLQAVQQTSPTTSGFYLFPPLIGDSISAIATGIFITWTRRMKSPLILGSICVLGGAIAAVCLSADTPLKLVPWLLPFSSIGLGFFYPAATIAVLALNTQEDQAVATTTTGLVRSLGSILGVAFSSWILQNALPVYLNKYVTAPSPSTKQDIIRSVRESIRFIRHLDPVHKKEVVAAYAISLRVTFCSAILFAVVSVLLVLPARLPRLQQQEDLDKPDARISPENLAVPVISSNVVQ